MTDLPAAVREMDPITTMDAFQHAIYRRQAHPKAVSPAAHEPLEEPPFMACALLECPTCSRYEPCRAGAFIAQIEHAFCHSWEPGPCCDPHHLVRQIATLDAAVESLECRLDELEHPGTHRGSLSMDDVREIRDLFATGQHRQCDLAIQFGITQGAVNKIVRGRTYKEVDNG